jgi:hypothetical protein
MKSLPSLPSLLATLLLAASTAACVAEASSQTADSESADAAELDTLTRRLACYLEYTRYSPDFRTVAAGSFDELMSTVNAQGATASDGKFAFVARVNPTPPYNLSFQVSLRDVATGNVLGYTVLPKPRLGGDYLFELGARIAPVTLPVPSLIADETFDFLRSYCTLYLAE